MINTNRHAKNSTVKITNKKLKRNLWDKKELKLASRRYSELQEIINV